MSGYRWGQLGEMYRDMATELAKLNYLFRLILRGEEVVIDSVPMLRMTLPEVADRVEHRIDFDQLADQVIVASKQLDILLEEIDSRPADEFIPLDYYQIFNQTNENITPIIRWASLFEDELNKIDRLIDLGLNILES